MAGYRIVLNLTGNASRKIAKMTKDLVAADVAAKSLAGTLTRVSAASHTIAPIRSSNGYRGGSRGNVTRGTVGDPVYTRHRSTRIASFGTGFNIGGFNGRLSTILQPDARGNIMGMNASKLMKGANIAALATSIVGSVAKSAAKVIGGATLAPLAIGGGVMMAAVRALQSEGFADGVRLISRQRQAKLGLGADFEVGQRSADFLASSYGFDRSTTLSSINVLSGMGVGGTGRKLTTGEATGLTKVGGLIAQQSGVSFERVMTNIQQLLVQTVPHVRDIREMLNQAPILGKYALKDMEEQGVEGVDARTWLKDQKNIFSAMKRYELDLASNSGMQARGRIALAIQDFWKALASNDDVWKYVGQKGSGLIGAAGKGVNNVMSMFENNDAFRVMVEQVETLFNKLGDRGTTFMDKLITLIERIAQKYGLDLVDRDQARIAVGRDRAIDSLVKDEYFKSSVLSYAKEKGAFKNVPESYMGAAESEILTNVSDVLKADTAFTNSIKGLEQLQRSSEGKYDPMAAAKNRTISARIADKYWTPYVNDTSYIYKSPINKYNKRQLSAPPMEYGAFSVSSAAAERGAFSYIDDLTKVGTYDPDKFKGVGEDGNAGSSLTGMNRDRKALEIHFNAPIVEWNNTMETATPEETVTAVADNIEEIASAAIQKALLGASNKMSTQWY